MSLVKALRALLPASNSFLDKGRITTSSLFSQFNYQKYQLRSSRCWSYYCEKHSKLPDVLSNESIRMNLDPFSKWFSK